MNAKTHPNICVFISQCLYFIGMDLCLYILKFVFAQLGALVMWLEIGRYFCKSDYTVRLHVMFVDRFVCLDFNIQLILWFLLHIWIHMYVQIAVVWVSTEPWRLFCINVDLYLLFILPLYCYCYCCFVLFSLCGASLLRAMAGQKLYAKMSFRWFVEFYSLFRKRKDALNVSLFSSCIYSCSTINAWY